MAQENGGGAGKVRQLVVPRLLTALNIDLCASSQQRASVTCHPSHYCRLHTSTQRALSGLNASDPLLSALSLTLRLSWTT